MFELNSKTGEIKPTTTEAAIESLQYYGWKQQSFNGLTRGAVVLFTDNSYFCRFPDRLENMRDDLNLPKPAGEPALMTEVLQ